MDKFLCNSSETSNNNGYIISDKIQDTILEINYNKELNILFSDIINNGFNEAYLDELIVLDMTEINNHEYKILLIFDKIFDIFSNKKMRPLYQKSHNVCLKIFDNMNPWITTQILDTIIEKITNTTKNPVKENGLSFIIYLTEKHPYQIKYNLIKLIPIISNFLYEINKTLASLAGETMGAIIKCNDNKDLDPFIPVVLDSLINLEKIPDSIEQLAGCVFVQNVEAPALAVTVPILNRGLNERLNETKRKACVIIDNMCKLVEHPKEILPMIDQLKPYVIDCAENISDPEARSIAEKALKTIDLACGENDIITKREVSEITDIFKDIAKENNILLLENYTYEYVCKISTNLCNANNFSYDLWLDLYKKYLSSYKEENIIILCQKIFEKVKSSFDIKEDIFVDTEEGMDLYKGEFSLAYGALTLLNNTHLHLKRNRFYGLLGPNNCGKTTLMRAIANEQVDGFPKKDELKTIFVEHEIQEREVDEDEKGYPIFNIDLCGIDWVVDCCNEVYKMNPPVTREDVELVMEDIGFGNSKKDTGKDRAADAEMGVTTYSGGWKMKMQLCAATLMNADILMLDEPTGHLDTKNIAWLKKWLTNFKDNGGSIITTSHDSSFLDEMCSHIIDFQNRKLVMFKGEKGKVLKLFVDKFPEKKGYFELKNDVMKFIFPNPSPFSNGKSSKAILKMNNVTYQYPIRDKPTVMDVSLVCNTSSRVAVIGPNGAGKSTAIKLLIGELKPNIGTIWKNPDARIAYVAQHAFQHLEKHITKTPTQYILWRFAGNEDKENLEFKAEDLEENTKKSKYFLKQIELSWELKKCNTPQEEKLAIYPDYLMDRKENKKQKTKEYEVKWKNKTREESTWVKREILIDMGFLTMAQRFDEKLAAEAGLMSKTLTSESIEKHLQGFGIDPEQASHTLIGSLSGGQKVKVVLAASMWLNPHLVILDEPTNYLDRDGLGALTKAIESFKGGVVIISHNKEFANAVSQEKWIMEGGRLRKEGESIANMEEEQGNKIISNDDFIDACGNVIKVTKQKDVSEKGKKQEIKRLNKILKSLKKEKASEEEIWEIEDKIALLQDKQ